jgi:hypothetical protein
MTKIGGFDPDYHTAICDAVPDLTRSVRFDWDKKEIENFDQWMDQIRQRLAEATGVIKTSIVEEICPGQPDQHWLGRSAADDQHLTQKFGNTYKAWKP